MWRYTLFLQSRSEFVFDSFVALSGVLQVFRSTSSQLTPDTFASWARLLSRPARFDELERAQTVTSFYAIGGEIPPIDRKHLVEIFGLSHGHERGICQIHRMIGIFPHQLESAIQRFGVEKPHGQSAVRDEMNEVLGADAARREQVKRFREDGRCGSERLGDGLENLSARPM